MDHQTLLIVEDHAVLRSTIRDLLETHFRGFSVLEAETGEEALTLAATHPPEIVLMDISLPGINGLEATRRLKERFPKVRVVIVTIHDNATYREDAMSAGASAYVLKRRMGQELVPVLSGLLPVRKGTRQDGETFCDGSDDQCAHAGEKRRGTYHGSP